jgi:hypothetical protein
MPGAPPDAGTMDAGACVPISPTHEDAGPNVPPVDAGCTRDVDCAAGTYCYAPKLRCVKPSDVGFTDGPGQGGHQPDGGACFAPLIVPAVCDATTLDFAPSLNVSREMGSLVESDTVLAADGHGTVVAAWAQVPMPPKQVDQRNRLAVSHDDGAHFTLIDAPTDAPTSAANDAVLAYDGRWLYVWEGYASNFQGAQHVWLSTSSSGDTWSAPLQVDTPGDYVAQGGLDFPWVSVSPDDHQPWITYQALTAAGDAMEKLVRFVDGGVTPSVELDDGTRPAQYRDLATHAFDPSGRFYATWLELASAGSASLGGVLGGSTSNAIRFARFDASGTRAGPDVRVSGTSDAVAFEKPAIVVNADFVYVAWVAGRANATAVHVAVSQDHGATFSAPVEVSSAGCTTQFHESLALDSHGRVWVFWYDNRDGDGHLLYAVSDDHGASFHPPGLVSAPAFPFSTLQYSTGWLGDYFQPAVANDTLYLLWSDGREGDQSHAFFTKVQFTY